MGLLNNLHTIISEKRHIEEHNFAQNTTIHSTHSISEATYVFTTPICFTMMVLNRQIIDFQSFTK